MCVCVCVRACVRACACLSVCSYIIFSVLFPNMYFVFRAVSVYFICVKSETSLIYFINITFIILQHGVTYFPWVYAVFEGFHVGNIPA